MVGGEVSGFDIGPAIKWYEAHSYVLLRRLEARLNVRRSSGTSYKIENSDCFALKLPELWDITKAIPQQALDRSFVRSIAGKPPAWFHKKSIPFAPAPATDISRRLSPTAIFTSDLDTALWTQTVPSADIWLYSIPDGICSLPVSKIIHYRAFCREFTRALALRLLSDSKYTLDLPGGMKKNGNDFIIEFSSIAETKPPISSYAGMFRDETGRFPETSRDTAKKAISEECAEAGAAYILGFSYCEGDDERGLNPFEDRQDVAKWMRDFFNARRASDK